MTLRNWMFLKQNRLFKITIYYKSTKSENFVYLQNMQNNLNKFQHCDSIYFSFCCLCAVVSLVYYYIHLCFRQACKAVLLIKQLHYKRFMNRCRKHKAYIWTNLLIEKCWIIIQSNKTGRKIVNLKTSFTTNDIC